MTQRWLRRFVVALLLIGPWPYRGVVELLHDLCDRALAVGTVPNRACQAAEQAGVPNQQAEAYRALGQLEPAADACRTALRLQPCCPLYLLRPAVVGGLPWRSASIFGFV